ncbi:hypothetical protein MKW94_026628 [Papaver nudicaule]|uniref:Uncharacterized protein n=1 Tax=Papaver nudicaule TaxID=74823 RepID=A0AA41VY01_PAPNU|nr:hypothetical protein [Papaver nudicaule]
MCKTCFWVFIMQTSGYSEDMIPIIGFNMRKVTKGNVAIRLRDLGGQPRFRSMWERYCRAGAQLVLTYVNSLYIIVMSAVCSSYFDQCFFLDPQKPIGSPAILEDSGFH